MMSDKPEVSIHLDLAATDEQKMSAAPLLDICPHRGTPTEQGFGLAGGGYGVYVYCPTEGCSYFAKHQIED